MDNFLNSMAGKAILGALIGWIVFFIVLCMIFGFPKEDYDWKFAIFLSMAPGVIVGILAAYIVSKNKNDNVNSSSKNCTPTRESETKAVKTVTEQLLEWKKLKDSEIISEDEFNAIKNKLLNNESNLSIK